MENQFTLRNKETHKEHTDQLVADETGSLSKEFGVNRNSILNELSYFNVCSGALLPDIMHDVLEGALQYEIKLMLQSFIFQEQYLTLSEINDCIKYVDLGYMEIKDRPTLLNDSNFRAHSASSKNTLKQSGKVIIIQMISNNLLRNMNGYKYNKDKITL